MIYWVDADHDGFKRVEFEPNFNVILAERTIESTEKDSRNGLGKSLLIDIIHFCLASSPGPGDVLRQAPLEGWTFSMELDVRGERIIVRRNTTDFAKILLSGNMANWPIKPKVDPESGDPFLPRDEWARLLGWAFFDLNPSKPTSKYPLSFRALISYFIRRDQSGFVSPFENARGQREWDRQLHTAFLLGLNWEHAQQWQNLKDKSAEITELGKALKTGVASDFIGSIGALNTSRVRLESAIKHDQEALDSFKVHEQYHAIEAEANRLTFAIKERINANVVDQALIELYQRNLDEESPADEVAVAELYAQAGVELPGLVIKRIEDVTAFHQQVVVNRRQFLGGEIERLRQDISNRDLEIISHSDSRAEYLTLLKTFGALEDFVRLQSLVSAKTAELSELNRRIALWEKLERENGAIRIDRERLKIDARADLDDRRLEWEEAISLFNANSEALYESPGELIIDLKDNGFRFEVAILRAGSEGIERMKVFCYDLMLAQRWSSRSPSKVTLIHDSIMFDAVDVRQRARALELAADQSRSRGFQYICCFNSDMVPYESFRESFDFRQYIRLTLTDSSEEGGLLGMRF